MRAYLLNHIHQMRLPLTMEQKRPCYAFVEEEAKVMEHKARSRTALLAITGWATLFISGCAVEVPKSALPAFRLTPPEEGSGIPRNNTTNRVKTPAR